jgi:hypothetical protein
MSQFVLAHNREFVIGIAAIGIAAIKTQTGIRCARSVAAEWRQVASD